MKLHEFQSVCVLDYVHICVCEAEAAPLWNQQNFLVWNLSGQHDSAEITANEDTGEHGSCDLK